MDATQPNPIQYSAVQGKKNVRSAVKSSDNTVQIHPRKRDLMGSKFKKAFYNWAHNDCSIDKKTMQQKHTHQTHSEHNITAEKGIKLLGQPAQFAFLSSQGILIGLARLEKQLGKRDELAKTRQFSLLRQFSTTQHTQNPPPPAAAHAILFLTVTASSCFGGPLGKQPNLFLDNVIELSCLKFANRSPYKQIKRREVENICDANTNSCSRRPLL